MISFDKQEITEEEFFEKTGAHWTNCLLFSQEPTYLEPISILERKLSNLFEPLYEQKRPCLYIKTGHSLHANELIKKGSLVTEYLGEWSNRSSPYRFGPIDGEKYRNYGAMINDSFPNTLPIFLFNIDNCPVRIVFIAIDDILKDEEITFNYGMRHLVKLGPHDEYRKEALISFFQEHSPTTLLKNLPQDLFEKEALLTKIQYLFHTPSALKILLEMGVIEKEEIASQLKNPYLYPLNPTPKERALIEEIKTTLR